MNRLPLSLTMLLLFCSAAGKVLGATYDIIDLGTLGGEDTLSVAQAINNSGQVVGYARTAGGNDHAFRTAANQPINPTTDDLGAPYSLAFGINNSGQVVGEAGFNGVPLNAFRTAPNQPINPLTDLLGTLGGTYATSMAFGVNDSGQVVGVSGGQGGPYMGHAFLWTNGQMMDLGTLGGTSSIAWGVNASGQVVGDAETGNLALRHAFRTAANQPINPATDDLGSLCGAERAVESFAYGINDSGQVVGLSQNSRGEWHAFRTAANQPINPLTDDLGALGGISSRAYGINASGQVVGEVGFSGTLGFQAFLYTGSGPMQDLNNLIPPGSGWEELSVAYGINDYGQIVGCGYHNGQQRAFLMTPIPEPSTCALLGMGAAAGLLALGLRRRGGRSEGRGRKRKGGNEQSQIPNPRGGFSMNRLSLSLTMLLGVVQRTSKYAGCHL